ncbi:hypothetical protein CCACVL1_30133 [Corchorus capsularis]|uniref:Uncharacterized protein n=1 Tax=Corchorus capsularis TaxID=210143 RepID=A0A1R3FYP8_COCAP|nr:hypothetical protein CCACVL1_30133 [Corchorus capsularis]
MSTTNQTQRQAMLIPYQSQANSRGRFLTFSFFNGWLNTTSPVLFLRLKVGVSDNDYAWAAVYLNHRVICHYQVNLSTQNISAVRTCILPPIPSYVFLPLPLGFLPREISDVVVHMRGISTRLPNVESRLIVFNVVEEVHMVRLIADLSNAHESDISLLSYEYQASTVFCNDDSLGLFESDSYHLPQVVASNQVVPNFPFQVVVCRIDFYDPAFITWLFFIVQGVERVRLLIIMSNSLVINTMASVLQGMSQWGFLKLGIIGSDVGIVAWRETKLEAVMLRSDEQLFHCLLRRRLG